MGMTLLPRAHPIMALCCWRCALSCAMSEVEVDDDVEESDLPSL